MLTRIHFMTFTLYTKQTSFHLHDLMSYTVRIAVLSCTDCRFTDFSWLWMAPSLWSVFSDQVHAASNTLVGLCWESFSRIWGTELSFHLFSVGREQEHTLGSYANMCISGLQHLPLWTYYLLMTSLSGLDLIIGTWWEIVVSP